MLIQGNCPQRLGWPFFRVEGRGADGRWAALPKDPLEAKAIPMAFPLPPERVLRTEREGFPLQALRF